MIDAHTSIDFGWATLSGNVARAKSNQSNYSDADISPLVGTITGNNVQADWWQQELVLTSKPGHFSWLGGLDFFQGSAEQNPSTSVIAKDLSTPPTTVRFGGQDTRSISAFGEATWEFVDGLFLTGGLRYTEDKKNAFFRNLGGPTTNGAVKYTNLSPRAVLRYQPTRNLNVYASFTQGYKTGTFNTITPAGASTPAKPEHVTAYEVGAKVDLGPAVRLSAAAFHYDYNDLQVTVTNLVNNVFVSSLQNAPASRINGLEFSAEARPLPGLTASLGVSLLNTKITDFPNASVVNPVRSPDWTANLALSYERHFSLGKISFSGNVLFSDKYYLELSNRVMQPAYTVVNASVTWTFPGDKASLSVFGENITSENYFAASTVSVFGDLITYAKPAWFGAKLSFKY
jgi:iron complex outermembrane receptor protein